MENRKRDDQKPRQQWAIRTTLEECQEVVREEAKGGERGQCNQSLLNAARLVEAVARATIKHFSCNKLKLKAEKKIGEKVLEKWSKGGRGRKAAYSSLAPTSCTSCSSRCSFPFSLLFFACFAHRKLELDVIFHAQTTCKAGGTRALKYYAYAACAAVLFCRSIVAIKSQLCTTNLNTCTKYNRMYIEEYMQH